MDNDMKGILIGLYIFLAYLLYFAMKWIVAAIFVGGMLGGDPFMFLSMFGFWSIITLYIFLYLIILALTIALIVHVRKRNRSATLFLANTVFILVLGYLLARLGFLIYNIFTNTGTADWTIMFFVIIRLIPIVIVIFGWKTLTSFVKNKTIDGKSLFT